MNNKYLPNGSVVLLQETDHRLMIYGRKQKDSETGKIYDYAGCFYPEGIQDTSQVMLFNADQIRLVFFIGFQDFEELAYRESLQEAYEKPDITR